MAAPWVRIHGQAVAWAQDAVAVTGSSNEDLNKQRNVTWTREIPSNRFKFKWIICIYIYKYVCILHSII